MTDMTPSFREIQYFRQPWLWVLVLGISLVSIWGAVQQLGLGIPFGTNPASDGSVILIAVIFGLIFPVGFYFMNLTTEVHQDGIYYRFFPFHLRFRVIGFSDVVDYEVRTYSALKDYGGWGIRYGRKGKAYNVSGNRGLWLKLSAGGSLLFGSQRPDDFAAALETAISQVRKGV